MTSDPLATFVHNAMCATGDDEVDCAVARRAIAEALRTPAGVDALLDDPGMQAALAARGFANTDRDSVRLILDKVREAGRQEVARDIVGEFVRHGNTPVPAYTGADVARIVQDIQPIGEAKEDA